MTAQELRARVDAALRAQQLVTPGARVVVAVSGGADSVALLHVLAALAPAWRLTLHVAHLDHGLRDASARDAAFVEALGRRWQAPATVVRREVGAICAREGWSLEDGARRIRYAFLLETARRQSAGFLALAHTADDQAETVLMRLMRGTGLLGLGAIPWTRRLEEVVVIRPLLQLWRTQLLAYLQEEGLMFREDASNQDTQFLRNRIRHHLLPLLEREYNPNIKDTLTRLADQSQCDYTYLQAAAERLWKRVARTQPGPSSARGAPAPTQVVLAVDRFRRQPKALQRQLVRQAIQRVKGDAGQLEFRHWFEIERLFGSRPIGTRLDLPGRVQLRREKDRVVCAVGLPAPA